LSLNDHDYVANNAVENLSRSSGLLVCNPLTEKNAAPHWKTIKTGLK
jgi:hypothetical protein